MAALAVLSVTSTVCVILLVTVDTVAREFEFGLDRLLVMAGLADQFFMGALERKLGLLTMLEPPDSPSVGVMA